VVTYFHQIAPGTKHYTCVSPEEFKYGLQLLLDRFEPVDPSGLSVDTIAEAECDNRRRFMVTFDDGHASVIEYAVPHMERLGVKGICFIDTDAVGVRRNGVLRLGWSELAALAASGYVIGAHTKSHRSLDAMSLSEGRYEVLSSIDIIESKLGTAVRTFAYPFGQVPLWVRDVVELRRVLCFGTVRAQARSWTVDPFAIRRTYLPANSSGDWAELVECWAEQL
jgi:peptidoglycan/xylan/chitin deacetylase (PgdA/CDA1 family)